MVLLTRRDSRALPLSAIARTVLLHLIRYPMTADSCDELETGEMPFLEHLEELRWRILKMLTAAIVVFILSLWICTTYDVVGVLITPIRPFLHGKPLYYTHPVDRFTILIQIAAVLAAVVASPVIVYQVWAFLSPALHKAERKIIIPLLVGAAAMFLAGSAVSIFVFVPITMKLLEGLPAPDLVPLLTASEYFGFLFSVTLAFGAMFELPIVIQVLTRLGFITPKLLTKYRRHAFVILLIVSEIITPGDAVISTLVLFVPIYGLYEISIVLSWFTYRGKLRRETQ